MFWRTKSVELACQGASGKVWDIAPARTPVIFRVAALLAMATALPPFAHALPSFARQTGQRCSACHVGGNWPQLTPWGRYFKLSGYTAGEAFVGKNGFRYAPIGGFGQVGATWANQPNNSQGQPVISPNGSPEAYQITGEAGTKLSDFAGMFYEYQYGNNFPGWTGSVGALDIRAVHAFYAGGKELLLGFDTNNNPTVQDVWNTVPNWGYPFYASPQAQGGPASPMITSLGGQAASLGGYALFDRHWYGELSMYRVATGFFRWYSAGTFFNQGGANYVDGYNPYWRFFYTTQRGPHVFMAGAFGMHANVYPNSAAPSGPVNAFNDYGFDSQYQYLPGGAHQVSLRATYLRENQDWTAGYPQGASSALKANLTSLNLNGTYTLHDKWAFSAGYNLSNGSNNAAIYGITSPSGALLTSSPNTTGYTLGANYLFTQNLKLMVQYNGFTKFNGLKSNIDGLGRSPSDNNTLWISLFLAY